jgi:G:T-mismatch repair DNA endonuclease (very short patch repair protein)
LGELGWDVAVVWECETEALANLDARLSLFLGGLDARRRRGEVLRLDLI